MLKDIVANEIPGSFKGEIYATPTILLGILYFIFKDAMSNPFIAFFLIFGIFLIRVMAIQYGIRIKRWKDLRILL